MQDPFSLKGPLRIVQQVPLQAKSIAIELGDQIPTSDNYRLVFSNTWDGQVRLGPSFCSPSYSSDGQDGLGRSKLEREWTDGNREPNRIPEADLSNSSSLPLGCVSVEQIFAQSDKFSVVAKGSGKSLYPRSPAHSGECAELGYSGCELD